MPKFKQGLLSLLLFLYFGNVDAQTDKRTQKLFNKASYFQNHSNPKKAIRLFSKIISKHEEHYLAINNRSLCYNEVGLYQEALNGYDRLIEINPSSGIAFLNKGISLKALGQNKEAMDSYKKAEYLAETRLDILFSNIGLLMSDWHGDYDSAMYYHNKAIKVNPSYARAYIDRARTYRGLKKYEQAEQDLISASELNQNSEGLFIGYGLLLSDLKKFRESNEKFTTAIKLAPSSFAAYYNRGWNYLQLRQFERASEDFTMAIKNNPTQSNAYNNRGLALQNLNKQKKAIEDFKISISLKADQKFTYNNMANSYFKLEQNSKACEFWRKALENGYVFQEEWKGQYGIEDPEKLLVEYCE